MNKGTQHWDRGRSDIMIGISTLITWDGREGFSKAGVGCCCWGCMWANERHGTRGLGLGSFIAQVVILKLEEWMRSSWNTVKRPERRTKAQPDQAQGNIRHRRLAPKSLPGARTGSEGLDQCKPQEETFQGGNNDGIHCR